ncbi:MAG: spore coat U domain-containing protein [Tsuneonella troitsensis]
MRKIVVTAALAAALAATPSFAAEKTADMEVTLNVLNNCTLTTPAVLDFGTVTDVTTATASGAATVNCTIGTPYALSVGMGENEGTSGSRRMVNTAGDLFVPYSILLNGSAGSTNGNGTGADQTQLLAGTLQPTGPVAAGSYSDLVVVSLTY